MKNFRQFFFLSILFVTCFTSFIAEIQAQSRNDIPAIVFNSKEMNLWKTAPIPARLPDGKVLLATLKRDGTQVFAKVRQGKIVQIGQQTRGKTFKALKPQRSPYCGVIDCGYAYSYVWCYVIESNNQIIYISLCMGDFTIGD